MSVKTSLVVAGGDAPKAMEWVVPWLSRTERVAIGVSRPKSAGVSLRRAISRDGMRRIRVVPEMASRRAWTCVASAGDGAGAEMFQESPERWKTRISPFENAVSMQSASVVQVRRSATALAWRRLRAARSRVKRTPTPAAQRRARRIVFEKEGIKRLKS